MPCTTVRSIKKNILQQTFYSPCRITIAQTTCQPNINQISNFQSRRSVCQHLLFAYVKFRISKTNLKYCLHTIKNSNNFVSSVLKIFISKVLSKRKPPVQSRADAQDFILRMLNFNAFQEMKCKPPHQTPSPLLCSSQSK